MDKVHFPQGADAESDEEDYSASVNAVILRRASTKKSQRRASRRASSPFSPDILPGSLNGRRRSSVFTTSSGDTAITMDENVGDEVSQEEIFENIKIHKEVLSSVKMEPWNMRKKLKLVMQAKSYIKKHEGALQERLAQSHSTRDMLARWHIYLIKKWQRFRREIVNLTNWFIPWELKIKKIESHFGSVVASYFIFLRWLFCVNIVLAVVLISFVAIPEMLTADPKKAADRKFILAEEKYNATNFLTLWDFEGVFKYSPLFYGWYTNSDSSISGYRLPFAYFVTGLVVYAYSFFAILRKMAENSRMSKLSEKDDECIFSWKLFTAWDYMIGNAETAHNRVASIVVGFKEALLEEAEKKRESRNWKTTGLRILVNTGVLGLLVFSAFAVVMVVKRSTEPEATSTVWRRNEITVIMSLISVFFPMIFEVLGFMEQYHPRKQLRLQLARIMALNLLNLYSLIFALFDKISDMAEELDTFRNYTPLSSLMTTYGAIVSNFSTEFPSICCQDLSENLKAENLIMSAASTISSSVYPIIQRALTTTTYEAIPDSSTLSSLDFSSTTAYNSTNSTDINFNDIQDAFVDYLTYILFGFSSNASEEFNLTSTPTASTNFEEFKSTISPFFRTEIDERFDTELSTVYEELTTVLNIPEKCNVCTTDVAVTTYPETSLNYTTKSRLRSLCWETMFGQELIKLTVMDLIMTILSTLAMDFFRGIFVRVMNRCWCWDLEKRFPQYADFKVAENILHLVNNQGMVWMGMFFSPGLVVLNVIKLHALMYFRSWTVLTCNVPHEVIFRASRSNNFYYSLLLMMLFLCVLPVGYAIVWVKPSWHCGPFSKYFRIFHIFTKTIKATVPQPIEKALDYIASPGIVIPLLVLLILVIYYLLSLTNSLREANDDLKVQLRRERTVERRRVFQIADRRLRRGTSTGSGEFAHAASIKWKKLLSNMQSGKSLDDTPKESSGIKDEGVEAKRPKDLFSIIKKALGKSSTSDDDNHNDDATDNEQHESLPEDVVSIKETKAGRRFSISSGSFKLKDVVANVLQRRNSRKDSISNVDKQVKSVQNREVRQDSGSSMRSDNIPVITISKTESAEFLDEIPERDINIKPKIKYALKKQSSEIDEDIICHFPNEIGRLDDGKSESSEDTGHEGSVDTVLNAPNLTKSSSNGSGTGTESSSEYNEAGLF